MGNLRIFGVRRDGIAALTALYVIYEAFERCFSKACTSTELERDLILCVALLIE